ncbi:CAP domain-containing protein [Mucilaginibacter pallidiroseus]|uniref:CAP domain-containing protein n=1 Tax=Mucilaginibacter pallidiroseus TaxID=2599295 RepID=A0A563UHY1_9SPHI|nr:CAP domain-containing protein [Mucilaginibacter pallidiroseus]TWR30992.1 CAP domain-containing protein [Mucilaginibacter pallidiroseus]
MKKYLLGISFIISVVLFTAFTNSDNNASFKNEFLSLINDTRTKGCKCGSTYYPPAPPLVWNDDLEKAAEGHARDMAKKNYFSHDSKDGRSMSSRIITAGYIFKGFKSFAVGENIAFGQTSIAEVTAGWFKSEGHCKNLMNPTFKEVGVAEKNKYWVQDFGGRESFSPEQQKLIKAGKYKLIQKSSL